MSSNLYWRPVSAGQELLSDELKHALHNLDQFNNGADGTCGDAMIPTLRGMEAAGIKDARKLINAIEKYGEVELSEEW